MSKVLKVLTASVSMLSIVSVANAYDPRSSSAENLKSIIYYRDVCPYGRVKTPYEVGRQADDQWAYIPDGTKRAAEREVYWHLDNVFGIEKFCKAYDDFADKDYPGGNPLEVQKEKKWVPEFGVWVTGPARITNTQYQFYTVVNNGTDQRRDTTEWTCTLTIKNVKVYEEKVKVDKVEAHSRVIAKQTIYYDGNADSVQCK